jgi:hypothetical protein
MLSGCGAVFKSRYYKPSLPGDSHYSSKEWGNGLAVVTENICVWARETQTAYHQMISEGPLGLPVIPHDMSEQIPERSPIVGFEIWVTVDKDYAGYSIDPKKVTLIYNDGSEVKPETVGISRFKTKWEEPYFHILPASDVEHLDQAEHQKTLKVDSSLEPVNLWNWTRMYISYSRPSRSAVPAQLKIQGIGKNGEAIEVPALFLNDIETTSYQVAGNLDTPADPCRNLFNTRRAQ